MQKRSKKGYQKQLESQKAISEEKVAQNSDIGPIPDVVDPLRRESCRLNLHLFLKTYFPASTGLSPFSPDHLRVIDRVQRSVLEGGLFVEAVYRGFAKTTVSENSAIWAVIYGHRKFVPIFAADASAAMANIDSVKLELAENDLLYADFPEVCHPVRALEWKPQRCASQTYGQNGTNTHIEWRADTIVLPTISMPGTGQSASSGAILTAGGIAGGCRGMTHKRPDGTQQRPDMVIIDDPQTDESAGSPLQVRKRLDVLRKSILKLGGHDRRIAVVVTATVIRPDDMVEQLLDPRRFPSWQGERIKMVRKFSAVHETMWMTDYARLRTTHDSAIIGDQQRAHRAATDFYKTNRPKMDDGCEVSWEHCFDKSTELSAIQHAYNLLIDDGAEVFASECQNEPFREESEGQQKLLSADDIAKKVNGFVRGVVPIDVSRIVSFVDVQKEALYWVVCGFSDGFTGYVLDYGAWPGQGRKYFSLRDVRKTIQKVTGETSLEKAVYAGLDTLTGELATRDFRRDDGAVLKIERQLIDANWGESTDIIYQFCRQSPHSAILTPSHGRYVGATTRSFSDWRPKPGDRVGLNWRMPSVAGRRQVRYVIFDTNFWKGFLHKRLATSAGGKGCLSLFGDSPEEHRMIADHICSETQTEVEAKGRKVMEFKIKPGRPDNHFLDGLVGCHVAASMQGIGLIDSGAKIARKRVSLSELQKSAKTHRAKGSTNAG